MSTVTAFYLTAVTDGIDPTTWLSVLLSGGGGAILVLLLGIFLRAILHSDKESRTENSRLDAQIIIKDKQLESKDERIEKVQSDCEAEKSRLLKEIDKWRERAWASEGREHRANNEVYQLSVELERLKGALHAADSDSGAVGQCDTPDVSPGSNLGPGVDSRLGTGLVDTDRRNGYSHVVPGSSSDTDSSATPHDSQTTGGTDAVAT